MMKQSLSQTKQTCCFLNIVGPSFNVVVQGSMGCDTHTPNQTQVKKVTKDPLITKFNTVTQQNENVRPYIYYKEDALLMI